MKRRFLFIFMKKIRIKPQVILSGVACATVIISNIFTAKATPKALLIIQREEENKNRELTKKEIIKNTWKCYIPSLFFASTSIICICLSNKISVKQIALLSTAYGALRREFSEYRNAIISENPDLDKKINENINIKKALDKEYPKDEGTLFFDSYSDRYFRADLNDVLRAEYELQQNYVRYGNAYINDFYEYLGLNYNPLFYKVGWSKDDIYIQEPTFLHDEFLTKDKETCILIMFGNNPYDIA